MGLTTQSKPARAISVFFPCFNEEASISQLVAESLKVLPTISRDFEIILVDDGSTDSTGTIADELAQRNGRIRVVHHERNLGYGAALASGFRAATKELVFYTDGDGQFDIAEIALLLPLIRDCDIVSGYRTDRQDSVIRRINAFFWNLLVRKALKFTCRDVDGAFKLYRREIFDHVAIRSTGALVDAEILARANRAGYRISQVGVHHRPRMAGKSTGAKLSVIFRAFRELFRLRKDILTTPRSGGGYKDA